MAVLGLHFCARAFSSCGKWGPLFIAVRRPLTIAASLVAEHRLQTRRLSNCGPVAPRHAGSSQTRARTRVPCIGRQTPNYCATREAPSACLFILFIASFCHYIPSFPNTMKRKQKFRNVLGKEKWQGMALNCFLPSELRT